LKVVGFSLQADTATEAEVEAEVENAQLIREGRAVIGGTRLIQEAMRAESVMVVRGGRGLTA
jgi:hypothetical protein